MSVESFYHTLLFLIAWMAMYLVIATREEAAMCIKEFLLAGARLFRSMAVTQRDNEALISPGGGEAWRTGE